MSARAVHYLAVATKTAICLLAAALPGCSADAVDPPEPTIETPGAFVAYEEGPAEVRLIRSFQRLVADDNSFLFAAIYDPLLPSYAAAEQLARDRSAAPRNDLAVFDLTAFALPYRVVWFRSLTDEERARLP